MGLDQRCERGQNRKRECARTDVCQHADGDDTDRLHRNRRRLDEQAGMELQPLFFDQLGESETHLKDVVPTQVLPRRNAHCVVVAAPASPPGEMHGRCSSWSKKPCVRASSV